MRTVGIHPLRLVLPAIVLAIGWGVAPGTACAQTLTGTLIGTVADEQGGVLRGATVRLSSPALIGSSAETVTSERWQLRFLALPPGRYTLLVDVPGFTRYQEEGIDIGVGATIERSVVLALAICRKRSSSKTEPGWRRAAADSKRGSAASTSTPSRPGVSACSTSCAPCPASRPIPRADSIATSPRSVQR